MKVREYLLNESGLSRLWKHMKEHDAGMITAYRSKEYDDDKKVVKEYTSKENKARNKSLLSKLISRYSVTKVKGAYIENYGSDIAEEVGESVFFVVDIADRGNLEKTLRSLGREFNQDTIMFVPKGQNKGILIGTKKDEYSNKWVDIKYLKKITLPKAVWGKEAEFMTRVKGRPFIFEDFMMNMDLPKGGFLTRLGWNAISKKHWRELL